MKKIARTLIISVLALFFSIACKNYTDNIDDYLSYWSTEASIAGYTFDTVTQTDAEGMQCVSSKSAVIVTFTVRNPKNFNLKMPGDSDAPADIISFPHIPDAHDKSAAAPQSGKDYKFEKISNTELTLTYNPAFLQKYEWGRGDITPSIILYTTDGRVFKQNIRFKLKVNTPPPAIQKYIIAQTKTASSSETSYYVLCLQLPADKMEEPCGNGLLHEDISGIEIAGIPYSLSVDSKLKQLKAQADSPFIDKDKVKKLTTANAENIPSDWTLYFKTDVKVMPGSAKKDYTVRLKDAKGLYSKSVTAMTQLNEPQQAQAAVITGTKIDSLSGDGTAQNQAIVVKAAALAPEAQIKLSVPDEDITIHYTLTEVGHTPTPEQTGISPVIVDMPLDGVGEKHYVLTYHTAGVGFKPSASITVYYKVLKEHTVTFDSKGGSEVPAQKILHGSQILSIPAAPTAPSGYTFRNWCIDEACTTAWDFDSGTVTSDITLYAKWDPVGGVSYTVQHFQQNINDNNYPTTPTATQTLSGTAETLTTATANNYAGFEPLLPIEQKTIAGNGTTVVKVKYKRKLITVTFKLAGGNISGSTADVPLSGKFGATFSAPTNPAKDGYTFNGWLPVLPSPLVFPAADTTYTAQWQEIPKPGMRIKEGISAEEKSYGESGTDDLVPNAEHHTNTTPLIIYKESGQAKLSITGSSGTTAYYRIDAGSETQGTEINLSADGSAHKLTVWAKKGTDDSIKTVLYVQVKDALTTYKELKNVVTHADDNAVINIGNNLNCTEESSEIEINKTLTVQRKTTSSAPLRYVINANEKGRFFKVVSGGHLTLKDLTLKNGKMTGSITTGIGGGIQVLSGGTCQLTNCIITECKAVNGGALIVAGRCTLTDSIVENNSFLAGGSAAAAKVMAAGTLVLEGNTVIKDNKTADGNPDAMAVVITGGITLKDSAQVEAGNNIHLSVETAYITVDGNLAASPTAARVSVPSFSAGIKVLAGNLTPDNIGKFTLVGFHAEQWKINASGNLEAVGGQSPAVAVSNWEDLRTQVQSVSDGTVIEVTQDITYKGGSSESTITVNKNITIKSKKSKDSNPYTLNADCTGTFPTYASKVKSIFEVSGGKTLTLENVTLSNAKQYAVSVAENCSLMMTKVTIKDCTTTQDNAAGIYFNKGKNLTLTGCTIEKCKGTGSASFGGINIQEPKGTVSIKDTTIKNCEVTGSNSTGGGIHLYKGTCTLTNVIIQECKAPKGGGMCVNAGTLTITGGSFTKNEATGTGTNIQGGAIYSEGGSLTLKGCMIGGNTSDEGNTAKKGGGIYLKNVTLTMEGVTVKNNKALTQGGGIYLADGELKIPGGNTIADNSIIDNGNSEAGGGIYVEKGTLTLNGGIISGNSANANKGGGVYLKAGTFTMNSGEIKNCSAKYGGGVSLAGKSSFTMTGGTITGCKADVEGGKGGGIYTELKTKLTLEGAASNPVVISNCTAKETGGGMHIYTQNTVTVKNARIEGNSANSGGGVYLEQGTFTIAGSTRITPSTETTAGKNDVFLEEGKFITIEGTLTETGIVARITPKKYENGVKVLQASSTECAKFTVTPKGTEIWSINNNDGTLKKP